MPEAMTQHSADLFHKNTSANKLSGSQHVIIPAVTIVVTQRERFSATQASLESLYQNTDTPFQLIYIDGGSPKPCRDYLRQQAIEKNFTLIRTEHYLLPNSSRNMGWQRANSEYLVFLENDVLLTKGWLTALLDCAKATDAAIVTPLILQQGWEKTSVHCMGGVATIRQVKIKKTNSAENHIIDAVHFRHAEPEDILGKFSRFQTAFAEFHCCLIKRTILQQQFPLDEILTSQEDFDFCLSTLRQSHRIYCEPQAVVIFQNGAGKLHRYDWGFYSLRWSNYLEMRSYRHLINKWDLTESQYFRNRYRRLGWRRQHHIIQPLVANLLHTLKLPSSWSSHLQTLLNPIEAIFNTALVHYYNLTTQSKLLNMINKAKYFFNKLFKLIRLQIS